MASRLLEYDIAILYILLFSGVDADDMPHSHDNTLEILRSALVGRYAIERPLGAGAMGRVFLGHDVTLDRQVAIKVISPDLAATSSFRERFLLEARTVAKLRHPSIVTVYTAGEIEEHLYFVMEYIPGESLRDMLTRTKQVDAPRAVEILGDLADALAYAHAQGVVHRDVKPENVLLDARTNRALLTDFGIARSLAVADDGRLTGVGLVVGSPQYMSPEQAAGERELDGRSDIYSLGLLGYEMLVGEPPFAGGNAASVLAKQIREPAPTLSERAPGIPLGLTNGIGRALEKDPSLRWADAASMAEALRGRDEVSVVSSNGSKTTAGRRRGLLVGGVAIALAAAVWLVARSGFAGADERTSILVMPFGVLRGDESLDWLRQGSVDMLTRNLAQWRDVDVVDYEHTLDLLREAKLEGASTIGLSDARQLARKSNAGTLVLGQIQKHGDSITVIGRVYDARTGNLTKEIPLGAKAGSDVRWLFDSMANELLGLAGAPALRKVQVARITTASVDAYRQYLRGVRALHTWDLEGADSAFARATEIDSTFALAYYKRALTQGWRRPSDTLSRFYARRAAANAARLPARERALVEGFLDQHEGNFARSRERFGALLAQDSTDAEAWYGFGEGYYHATPTSPDVVAKQYTTALDAFNRAIAHDSSFHLAYAHRIEIYERVAAPRFAWIVENDTIRYLASEEEARRIGRERIERARARARELAIQTALKWVDADPAAAPAYHGLADAYASAGRYNEAVATLQRAMREPSTRYADFPYRIASYQLALQPRQALRTLRDAMGTYGPESLQIRSSASRFGTLVTAANVAMHTGALRDLDRLLAITTSVDSILPGTERSGHPMSSTSQTLPLRFAAGAFLGVPVAGARPIVDAVIARFDSVTGPRQSVTHRQSLGIAYGAYVFTRDPKYLDIIRRWSGRDIPVVLQAVAALEAGDTAQAAKLVAQLPPPDSSRLVTPPESIEDPLTHANVLSAIGQRRDALAVLESLDPRRFGVLEVDPRWAMYPKSLLARGLLYEDLGDRARAIASYERYLELMRDADAALQPQLQLARARVRSLRDSPAVPLTR